MKVKEHNTLIKEINKGRSNKEIEVGDITVAPIDEIEKLKRQRVDAETRLEALEVAKNEEKDN